MRIVAFTGMPGAGKSAAVEVCHELGLPVVRMGDMVREEAKARLLPMTDEALGGVANEMRKREGMDVWAKRTCARIRREHTKALAAVIEGIRNPEEVERIRQEFGKEFLLVAIVTPPEVRTRRLKARARADAPADETAAATRDRREQGWGIEKVMAMANTIVANEGSLDELRGKVKELLTPYASRKL